MATTRKVSPGEFFDYLHKIRTTAQLTHNAQPDGKLSTHLVMGEIYEGITGIMDGLIESYQGIYDIVRVVMPECKATSAPNTEVATWYRWIEDNREIFEESWIQNQIDNIAQLLATSLYKLKHVR